MTNDLPRFDLMASVRAACVARGSCSFVLVDEPTGLVECQDCDASHVDPAQAVPEIAGAGA